MLYTGPGNIRKTNQRLELGRLEAIEGNATGAISDYSSVMLVFCRYFFSRVYFVFEVCIRARTRVCVLVLAGVSVCVCVPVSTVWYVVLMCVGGEGEAFQNTCCLQKRFSSFFSQR